MAYLAEAKFKLHIHSRQSIGTCGLSGNVERPFVARCVIEEYWTSSRIWEPLEESPGRSITEADVSTIRTQYLAVFSILVFIGKTEAIYDFLRHPSFDDAHLPFNPEPQSPDEWPFDEVEYEDFYARQWQFCAPNFQAELLRDVEFAADRILPFVRAVSLGISNYGSLYKAKIHSDYNLLCDEFSSNATDEFLLQTFVVEDAEPHYRNKVIALQQLTDECVEGMVPYYGSWRQGTSFNILLEYAQGGSLEDYYARTKPPTSEEDITMFWRSLLGIVEPLERIHAFEAAREDPCVLRGFHGGITLSSILAVNATGNPEYDAEFKLAAYSVNNFQKPVRPDAGQTRRNCHDGNHTYSAPETFRNGSLGRRRSTTTPAADIWSLGCIFSEALSWVVLGEDGRKDYARLRRTNLNRKRVNFAASGYGECFHDGKDILTAVKTMHSRLVLERRYSDKFTELIIMLVWHMLKVEPHARPTMRQILEVKHRIVEHIERQTYTLFVKSFTSVTFEDRASDSPRLDGADIFQQLPIPAAASQSSLLGNLANLVPAQTRTETILGHNTSQSQATFNLSEDDMSRRSSVSAFGPPVVPSPMATWSSTSTSSCPASEVPSHHSSRQDVPFIRWRHRSGKPEKPPYLSIDEVLEHNERKPLPYTAHQSKLAGRDHVFLIDDSASMSLFWPNVVRVVQALAALIDNADPDGIYLWFTSGKNYRYFKSPKHLLSETERRKLEGRCDMKRALSNILQFYRTTFQTHSESKPSFLPKYFRKPQEPKSLSVYVLTNGEWQDSSETDGGAEEPIRELISLLTQDRTPDPTVGIQFIQFGNDQIGRSAIEVLDTELRKSSKGPSMDAVDTTKYDGNVLKMLFGAFDRSWDDDDFTEADSSKAVWRNLIKPPISRRHRKLQ